MSSKRRPGAPADLEEVRPDLFVLHNPAVAPTLRGEGEREGDRFRLTTWRRDGLFARLRAKSFVVLTLADQIAALPALPPATRPGPLTHRPLAAGERLSFFAAGEGALPPGWQPAPSSDEGPAAVSLREGWIIRRRKGRGPAAYYRVGRGTLLPLGEDEALCYGLAQTTAEGGVAVWAMPDGEGYRLSELPLPAAHRALMRRFAEARPDGWSLTASALPLVAALLARLNLDLTMTKGPGG